MVVQAYSSNLHSTALILSSSAIFTPRQLSSETLDTSSMASGSYQRPGRRAFRWEARSAKSWVLFVRPTLWSGLVARRPLERVLSFPRGSPSYSSLHDRCQCFWLGNCWVGWYCYFRDECGTGWTDWRQILGTYVVVAPAYASEVCPIALRGILTSVTNIAFVTGQLIANGVIAGTSKLDSHWAYSAPFAAQWVWPLIILILWPFAPESPWWLVRKERLEDAERSLRQLASETVDVKPTLAMIIETDKLEHSLEAGSTYMDCFKPINLRRTEISIGVYTIQVLSGIYLVGYATYFFELAGLATAHAFAMGVGFLALGFLGTCCSWILLSYFGRRRIYNVGLSALIVLLLIIGILDCAPNYSSRPALAWTQSSLMLLWNFTYDLSIGPVCFVLICETSATRVRSKTIALATAVQAAVAVAMTVAIPYLINPDQANGRGKIGFFFGGLSLLSLVWAWFRVPETKGRTYEELDVMFARGVKTREFRDYRVESTTEI